MLMEETLDLEVASCGQIDGRGGRRSERDRNHAVVADERRVRVSARDALAAGVPVERRGEHIIHERSNGEIPLRRSIFDI